jgi:hypothetical protein
MVCKYFMKIALVEGANLEEDWHKSKLSGRWAAPAARGGAAEFDVACTSQFCEKFDSVQQAADLFP